MFILCVNYIYIYIRQRTIIFMYEALFIMFVENVLDYYFPDRDLDMSNYSIGEPTSIRRSPVYELYGVINHHGGLLGGHYTAYARCPDTKLKGIGGFILAVLPSQFRSWSLILHCFFFDQVGVSTWNVSVFCRPILRL